MPKTYRIKCSAGSMRRNDQAWSMDMDHAVTYLIVSKVREELDRIGLSPLDANWFGDELARLARKKRCDVIQELAGDYNNSTHASTW